MSYLVKRAAANNALNVNNDSVNGGHADININSRASDWYFTVCACMTFATIVFLAMAMRVHRSKRIFHYITASVTMVAAIAYFTMGSDLGRVPIAVEFNRGTGNTREIFYVRYIDWVITTPLLLLDLLLTAAIPLPTILFVILVDEVMIITGLIGALVSSSYKWGYFVFGCVALFYVLYVLVWEARRNASALGSDIGRTFLICGSLTSFLWFLYPIAWGISEGGNVIGADGESIFYGILDLLAKPVFGALLIWGHRNIDPSRLGLAIEDYGEKDAVSNGTSRTGTNTKKHGLFGKKSHANADGVHNATNSTSNTNGVAGVTNGTTTNGTTHGVGHQTTTTNNATTGV